MVGVHNSPTGSSGTNRACCGSRYGTTRQLDSTPWMGRRSCERRAHELTPQRELGSPAALRLATSACDAFSGSSILRLLAGWSSISRPDTAVGSARRSRWEN